MKKRLLALMMAAMMAFALAACGSDDAGNNGQSNAPDSSSPAGEQSSEPDGTNADFKVGAIYINSKNDTAGYTYAHNNGITTAMKDLGLDVDSQLVIVDEVAEDYEAVSTAVDTLVGEGCNIIFGISFGYIDALADKAEEYPEVIFSHATGYKSNETNFNNYFGRIYQARYLAGVAAGLKSLEEAITASATSPPTAPSTLRPAPASTASPWACCLSTPRPPSMSRSWAPGRTSRTSMPSPRS